MSDESPGQMASGTSAFLSCSDLDLNAALREVSLEKTASNWGSDGVFSSVSFLWSAAGVFGGHSSV